MYNSLRNKKLNYGTEKNSHCIQSNKKKIEVI